MSDCCKRRIWRYKPSATPGLNYRWWSAAAGPHLDPLQWSGPADPVTGFPLPVSAAPDFTGINNSTSISDSNSGAGAARYGIIHGWVWLPDDVTHWRDNNANTGELGMVLAGDCCGGALVELPGGNHTVNTGTDRTLMDSNPVTGGWKFVVMPQSDASAFGGFDLEYSTDNEASWNEVTVQRPDKPEIQGYDISCCQEIPEGWSADPLQECCQPTYATGEDGLDEAAVQALIDDQTHVELCASQAVVDTGLTYIAPQIHRRGYRGTDTTAARCDHVAESARINPTPLTPELTYSGVGAMTQSLVLDRWSGEHYVAYAWRTLIDIPAGTGWGFVTIPNLAGFQRPRIGGIGTYRIGSTAVQDDDGAFGASPRGPFMGAEAHHWSSTQRIYMGYFRRDNQFRAYVEFWAVYECL